MKYVFIPKIEMIARNVIFSSQSEEFLKNLETKASNDAVKKYVKKNLRTWLINEYPGKLHRVAKDNDPDWVSKSLEREDEIFDISIKSTDKSVISKWIKYLNTLDPKKIFKISVPQLKEQATKWDVINKEQRSITKGTKILHKYSDGYKWLELLNRDAIVNDGKIMQNCLKEDSLHGWSKLVAKGDIKILSLHDKNGKPHISIEYDVRNKKISQIKGKQNGKVADEYLPYLLDLLNKKYIKYKDIDKDDLKLNGLLDCTDKIKTLRDLIPGDAVNGDIVIDDADVILPQGLIVNGDLTIRTPEIKELPDNLVVLGDLDIEESGIEKVPDNITVKGDVGSRYITKISNKLVNISELPDNLIVDGDLNLREAKNVKLPKGLVVKGDLDLMSAEISRLPSDLVVNGNLNIKYTDIEEIPSTAKIKNVISEYITNINGKYYNVNKLPEGMVINGDLLLRKFNCSKLPKNLTVNGKLDLYKCDIRNLPENLVTGNLCLEESAVKSLSKGTVVNGDLIIKYCPIEELPDDIVIKGKIIPNKFIKLNDKYYNVRKLPQNLTVNGDLDLGKMAITLPKGLTVNGSLSLRDRVLDLPDNLTVNGNLNLQGSILDELPKGMKITGDLNIRNTLITALPDDIYIGGDLHISKNMYDLNIPRGAVIKGKIIEHENSVQGKR